MEGLDPFSLSFLAEQPASFLGLLSFTPPASILGACAPVGCHFKVQLIPGPRTRLGENASVAESDWGPLCRVGPGWLLPSFLPPVCGGSESFSQASVPAAAASSILPCSVLAAKEHVGLPKTSGLS